MYVNGHICPFPLPLPLATIDLQISGIIAAQPDAVLGADTGGETVLMESGEGILGP